LFLQAHTDLETVKTTKWLVPLHVPSSADGFNLQETEALKPTHLAYLLQTTLFQTKSMEEVE